MKWFNKGSVISFVLAVVLLVAVALVYEIAWGTASIVTIVLLIALTYLIYNHKGIQKWINNL